MGLQIEDVDFSETTDRIIQDNMLITICREFILATWTRSQLIPWGLTKFSLLESVNMM